MPSENSNVLAGDIHNDDKESVGSRSDDGNTSEELFGAPLRQQERIKRSTWATDFEFQPGPIALPKGSKRRKA